MSLGTSFTRVLVSLLLDEGQLELIIVTPSSDADEIWRSGLILSICSSKHSSLFPEMLSLIRPREYELGGFLCPLDRSLPWCDSIFRSTRSRAQESDGQTSLRSPQFSEVTLVGDGGGAQGMCSL